jgi:hypothetical protein
MHHSSILASVLAAVAIASGSAAAAAAASSVNDEAQRHFYSGRYEAAVALTLPRCTTPPFDLDACELTTATLHFQIRRALGLPGPAKPWNTCAECPALLSTFLAVTARAQLAARDAIKANPSDDARRFLLAKLDLNYVWLQLATLGKKTGWKEYWEARHTLDDLVKRRPDMIRARVARAWIDYIVDTRMARGTRWLLGGGDRKRALRVMHEAANAPADFFVATEATFALWDVQVRERQMAEAVVTARRLARDFPENGELASFLARHDTASR